MQIDLSSVDDVESFISIPEGQYLCRVADVRPGLTREGKPRWSMRLEVMEGQYAGRTAAWDNVVWSERGLPRAKRLLEAFGFDVSRPLDLEPDDLKGRRIFAHFVTEEREDPATGQRVKRLRVPYSGFEAAGNAEDDLPTLDSTDRRATDETPF